MTDLIVQGGTPLNGNILPSANKNAVLPILCATLLTEEPVRLLNVPEITDVKKILAFFLTLGSKVEVDFTTGVLDLHHTNLTFDPQVNTLPQAMRSSVMLVPPLLFRFGAAIIEDDIKGCSLGVREIDPHIEIFHGFGATAEVFPDAVRIRSNDALTATHAWPDYASVTGTENFVLCAAIARGTSTLTNAASEPHVQEFCSFMAMLGARINGAGTSRLEVEGVDRLRGGEFRFTEDFHEVATFLALGAMTGGAVRVKNARPDHFPLIDRTFAKFGVNVVHQDGWSTTEVKDGLHVRSPFTQNILQKVEAAPWPYLPADLLPIFVALGVKAEGNVMYWNKVYEGALGWSGELSKFGAHATLCDPHRLIVFGGKALIPAEVESPYIIRVAIALMMIATSIKGRSVIRNALPIQRAHPHFAQNLRALGADVAWSQSE